MFLFILADPCAPYYRILNNLPLSFLRARYFLLYYEAARNPILIIKAPALLPSQRLVQDAASDEALRRLAQLEENGCLGL